MFLYHSYCCPQCGKKHDDSGRLGASKQCDCGTWLLHADLDKVKHYWIAQIALCFAMASFFVALTVFYAELPSDPWERLFSPLLQVPAFTTFIVSYRILLKQKRTHDEDYLLLRYYFWGVSLMSVAIIVSVLEAAQK